MDPRMMIFFFYFAPSALALSSMVRGRTLSFHRLRRLSSLRRRVTLQDWLAVYAYLGTELESRNEPPMIGPERPRRLLAAGALGAASVALLLIPLPFHLLGSFAQFRWDLFPPIQVAVAGIALASSLLLAFHRRRRWRLVAYPRADYPFLGWAALKKDDGRIEAKEMAKVKEREK